MKESFFDALCELAEADLNVEFIKADAGFNAKYQNNYANQYLNIGISEQNMIGVAAGMAFSGKTVFAYSLVDFTSLRTLDQIRVNLGYNCANVKVVSCGTGFDYCDDGVSHIAVDDISALRTVPNLVIFSPCDPYEAYVVTKKAAETKLPCFIRLGRGGEPKLHTAPVDNYKIGDVLTLQEGRDVKILVTGSIAGEALKACQKLNAMGINTGVYSCPTINPINKSFIEQAMKDAKMVLTVEEHTLAGGFGAMIAEIIADSNMSGQAIFKRIGVDYQFTTAPEIHDEQMLSGLYYNYTPAEYLKMQCKLTADAMVDCVTASLQ
ncbi:transketolase C-terminal domain-containing protein [Oscillibacter sp.]|uniref:transketolase family protein n=1 Tax=Oscillibacter sp. TaxID=1945593 RepID=UPI002896C344|nr:transketolase C-terminal domain-containing protein [Oscillibacter sp.]